jgi:hypothetical protein
VAADAANLRDSNILSRPKVIIRTPYLEYDLQLEPLRKWPLEKNEDILVIMVEGADYYLSLGHCIPMSKQTPPRLPHLVNQSLAGL